LIASTFLSVEQLIHAGFGLHRGHVFCIQLQPGLGRQDHVLDLRRQVALEAAQGLGTRRRVVETEFDLIPVVALGRIDEDRVERLRVLKPSSRPMCGSVSQSGQQLLLDVAVAAKQASMAPAAALRPWATDSISVEGPSTQSPPA
jgi:hypothetical protein